MLNRVAPDTLKSGPALIVLLPSWSCGKINTVTWNPCEGPIVIDASDSGTPWFHDSWTTAPTGNPVPITVTTVPGGPIVGFSWIAALVQGMVKTALAATFVRSWMASTM